MIRLITISFFLILFQSSSYAKQDWQNIDYIQQAFNEIALKNEYTTTKMKIKKWQIPIFYNIIFFKMPYVDLANELTTIHLNHLQSITNHPIQASSINNPPNFSIIFTQDKNYKTAIQQFSTTKINNIERESSCMGQFKVNQNFEITSATIIIPIDHAMHNGLLVSCIVEELTQTMGLPNDSDWVHPSIANDKSKIEFLTGLDYLMLKILYDNKIKAGMGKKKSQQNIKKILEKLSSSKVIKRSNYLVNKKGLYRYAN